MADPAPRKEEKTEAPTPKKMQKQKIEGNIFMSQELATAIVIFLGAWIIKITGEWIFHHFYLIFQQSFKDIIAFRPEPDNIQKYMISLIIFIAKMMAPTIFLLIIGGAASTLIQTGWIVSWKPAEWKFNKLFKLKWSSLNPINKKRIIDLGINFAKIILIGNVAFFGIKESIVNWIPLMGAPIMHSWNYIFALTFKITIKICYMLFVLAIIDFILKRKEYMENLKMTKWEVKDEKKQSEGDPKVKSALKSKRFIFFRKLMMEAIPKADVVITNPTHFAIAISYKADEMEAPKVIAKGAGRLAEKIKEIARKNNIPLVENKPLAQVLFKTVEVGSYIPVSLYKAVAEILAYVYKLKRKNAA